MYCKDCKLANSLGLINYTFQVCWCWLLKQMLNRRDIFPKQIVNQNDKTTRQASYLPLIIINSTTISGGFFVSPVSQFVVETAATEEQREYKTIKHQPNHTRHGYIYLLKREKHTNNAFFSPQIPSQRDAGAVEAGTVELSAVLPLNYPRLSAAALWPQSDIAACANTPPSGFKSKFKDDKC